MNYMYDIVLNFSEKLYDFYDWNLDDEVVHIRKLPLLKVEAKQLNDIKSNIIKVDTELLEKIKNKTEVFDKRNVKVINYACLISDGEEVIGVKFSNLGTVINISKMVVDEEIEALEISLHASTKVINYEIVKKRDLLPLKTRNEVKKEEYVKKQLQKLTQDTTDDKLKYLYYECYNEKENDKQKIIKIIDKELEKNFDYIILKLYHFFKLTSI